MSQDALVDLITKEVLSVVKARSASSPEPVRTVQSTGSTGFAIGAEPLVVVCGNALGKSDAIRQFGALRAKYPRLGVVLSHAAVHLFEDSRRPFAGFTIDPAARDFQVQVAGYSSIIVLNTSVNVLAKVALLIADTPPTMLICNAIKTKKPVVFTTDGLLPWNVNPAVTARVQGYLRDVESYGLTVSTFDDLTVSARGQAAASPSAAPARDADCHSCAWPGHCARLCPDRVSAMRQEGVVRVASTLGMEAASKDIAGFIDHTLLKADATEDQVRKLCDEARRYSFASVCINPGWIKLSKQLLAGTRVMACTVVGFPLGATTSEAKAAETHQAVVDGADEIDMVINVGALKAGQYPKVLEDIRAVVRAAQGRTVKVIFETGLLSDDEKRKACELSVDGGADFVKTSTGFGPGGATAADIALMRQMVGPKIGVKASGGVRDFETARQMIVAGASRIGASASVAIVKGSRGEKDTGPVVEYGYGPSPAKPAAEAAPKQGSCGRAATGSTAQCEKCPNRCH